MADPTGPTQDPRPSAHPPVGSVAEEAARLLDALGGWVSTSGYAAGAPPEDTPAPDAAHASGASHASGGHGDSGGNRGGAGDRGDGDPVSPGETRSHPAGHCDQCGAANGTGQAVTCQWCPVCQGIGLLRSVRPETVDRLADLAGALATALRDVAAHGRGANGSQDPPAQRDHAGRATRVQDITIDDEDQGSATR